ncbi:MAG: hypothetical protein AAF789_01030, partial [Bacteroidota bacterium]
AYFQPQEFDIKEQNGFFFTGLGIITHLKYDNLEKVPPGMSLIEYEHIITQGRDIFVKVARLGYNSKTGQRYKHVIEGKRKIAHQEITEDDPQYPTEPTSFIELKQYCDCIDKIIKYDEEGRPSNSDEYHGIPTQGHPILAPASDTINRCDYKRGTYRELKTIEKERIPIRCLTDKILPQGQSACQVWFWPTRENATETNQDGKNVNYEDYLPCSYEAKDWEGVKISADTPFMFIRKDYIEDGNLSQAYSNYFSGKFSKSDEANLIKRRKTFFSQTKIAFTPTPVSKLEQDKLDLIATRKKLIAENTDLSRQQADSIKTKVDEIEKEIKSIQDDEKQSTSKINIQETEFIEHYFYVKKKENFVFNQDLGERDIAKTKFVVFPQVLRAKVFTDHVRDIALESIPSIIEYHKDYINHGFAEYVNDPAFLVDGTTGNGVKVILANTKAFVTDKEEDVNKNYRRIKKAIQRSKNQLGNLAVPDIIPDTFSLEKFGVTLPKDIGKSIRDGRTVLENDVSSSLKKIAAFNPRELLRGKLSDVCGLDLTAVLDELIPAGAEDNQTPLFEINKILDKIEGQVLNSPVYKAIVDFKIEDPLEPGVFLSPVDLIDKYEGKIKGFRNDLEAKRLELNAKIKELSGLIPNAEELDNMVKGLYEKQKAKALEAINEEFPFTQIEFKVDEIKEFLTREIKILRAELVDQREEIKRFIDDVKDDLDKNSELADAQFANLKTEIEKALNGTVSQVLGLIDKYTKIDRRGNLIDYKTLLDDQLNLFAKVGAESVMKLTGNVEVFVNRKTYEFVPKPIRAVQPEDIKAFELLNNIADGGLVQIERKVKDFNAVIAKNVAGTKFQRDAVEKIRNGIFKSYSDKLKVLKKDTEEFAEKTLGDLNTDLKTWEEDINTEIQRAIASGLSAETLDLVRESRDNILKMVSYVDTLRKIDPYFFYKEQKELLKEVKDVENRFKDKFFAQYGTVKDTVESHVKKYEVEAEKLKKAIEGFSATPPTVFLDDYNKAKKQFADFRSDITFKLNNESKEIVNRLKNFREYKEAARILDLIEGAGGLKEQIEGLEGQLNEQLNHYKKILQQQASKYKEELDVKINDFLRQQEEELRDAVGQQNMDRIQQDINEAKNIYRLITSIKKQDLTYNWNTTKFRDFSLGIVKFRKFSNPDTTLNVDVKATTHFSPGKFPPAIDRIVTYSENRFRNFGVTFFNALTVNFKEVSFIAGSDQSTDFDVQIKDVKFDGALSFVQAFESWLKTIGKGLILQLHGDHVSLGYSFPVPSIVTPSFSIFNISINFDLRLFFDSRPLLCGFQLSRKDSKFGIAAGIFAGFGFFGIEADTKGGIVSMECALEAGAWAGIRLGPIAGEVKLAFGFYYRKNQSGVRLEGYIVFEGRLSVWIISVSARVYLGVVSQNSYVEGVCTVTYSAKLGFVKKSFSGSYKKKVAGAKKNNRGDERKILNDHLLALIETPANDLRAFSESLEKEFSYTAMEKAFGSMNDEEVFETEPVSVQNWKKFITTF